MVIGKKKGGMIPGLLVLIGHDRLITTEIYLNLSPEGVIREFKEKWWYTKVYSRRAPSYHRVPPVWHWFSLMGTFLPFAISTYAI
jgi:hypothetical protein